ncbi:hypothetical protein [Aurantimonas sp. A3-2-R12]|uniref:hypothetical protein n=1 Tax=Aurantimonas sp. A3-2-R12 TaxID=3114362 RepID=UPI002E18F4BC|nr:hypothetical protein [Aurantimonas sp. A3-2-R12]
MIDANTGIFSALDDHCASRGIALKNAGKPRWIASMPMHRNFMINAVVAECLTFTPSRKLARVDISSKTYLLTIGFEQAGTSLSAVEMEITPAFLTVALSDLTPRPKATPSEIRDIVEWSDKKADSAYTGHDHDAIASLYPTLRIFDISGTSTEETWNVFFQSCIDECEIGASWIEGNLAATLRTLCDLESTRIPYRVLCRSVFDGDKSSFFLAQYRCLEALYAYSSAHSLGKHLSIKSSWGEIATALEDKLGWHPREEGSLERILRFSSPSDLREVLNALEKPIPSDDETLVRHSAKAIYWLRNSFVHYRPAQQLVDVESFAWATLSTAMTGIVLDVYEAVFSGQTA